MKRPPPPSPLSSLLSNASSQLSLFTPFYFRPTFPVRNGIWYISSGVAFSFGFVSEKIKKNPAFPIDKPEWQKVGPRKKFVRRLNNQAHFMLTEKKIIILKINGILGHAKKWTNRGTMPFRPKSQNGFWVST